MPSRSDSVRSQTNLQTITLEYITSGPFDGRTIAPTISLDPSSPDYVAPDPVDQVRRVVLPAGQAIGLIDLSLADNDGEGGIGDRYVRWVMAGNIDDSISFSNGKLGVYDDLLRQLQVSSDPLLLELVRSVSGVSAFYERSCIAVPQGSYLGISGLISPSEGVNLIRINVQAPMTDWEGALVEESCCCDSGGGSNPSTECPSILDISPSTIDEPTVPESLTIFGTGFRDGLAIEATRKAPDTPVTATLTSFAIVDENTATVDVASPTPPGTYVLSIFDPSDPVTCSSSGEFTVASASICPAFAVLDPAIPTTFTAGGIPGSVIINGTSLLNVIMVELRDANGLPLVQQAAMSFDSQTDTQIDTGPIAVPLVPPQEGTMALIPSDPFACQEVEIPITILGA